MDYRYIEQVLERYWACETSLEEERILRAFFAQDVLPAHLARYKALFDYQSEVPASVLGADFDERVCRKVKAPVVVKARRLRFSERLRPLYRAAASVAIVMLLGGALQHAFEQRNTYAPSAGDREPKAAYDARMDGSRLADEAYSTALPDSMRLDSVAVLGK